ncbi:MAG: hypothetical protein B7X04_02235 [Parcubacteria group bacterium 21-54-25]|nr:MAG: hypothetical protein B7X04_02235 [Parcubacteria group bacterium 21-54-25]HQU07866.1 hypothetical protein [Candidatus Paceibacterota bacterium]
MQTVSRSHTALYLGIIALLVVNAFIWLAVFSAGDGMLHISFLAVGEGRAVLVQSPTGATVLIDGGPDHAVLRALPAVLGPLNRSLNLVILTNPTTANAGGVPGIFDRYDVHAFMAPAVPNSSVAARMAAAAAGNEPQLAYISATRGARVVLGAGAFIDVLAPDRDVSGVRAETGSTVLRIVYGDTAFLLPSDAPVGVERWLAQLDATSTLSSTVLAVGHFGAKDTVAGDWLSKVRPTYAVLSVGHNPYGYPATTTLATLVRAGARVLTTASGTVAFVSDGQAVWRK